VGIVHRGPDGEDLLTATSADEYSIGSPSSLLIAAQSVASPLPAAMVSTATDQTSDFVVTNCSLYQNANVTSLSIGGNPTDLLATLGAACDAGLALTDFASPDDLTTALAPCYSAANLIQCQSQFKAWFATECPTTVADNTAWANRFEQANTMSVAMNGQLDYTSLTFGIADLQTTQNAGQTASATALRAALATTNPPLDFSLASALAFAGITSYGGTDLHDYVVHYAKVTGYPFQVSDILSTASGLYAVNAISDVEIVTLWASLYADSNVSVGDKLAIEEQQYASGAIPKSLRPSKSLRASASTK
jgi:hypothetical protein